MCNKRRDLLTYFMFETTLEAGQVAELLDEGLPQAIHALLKAFVPSCTRIDVEIHQHV